MPSQRLLCEETAVCWPADGQCLCFGSCCWCRKFAACSSMSPASHREREKEDDDHTSAQSRCTSLMLLLTGVQLLQRDIRRLSGDKGDHWWATPSRSSGSDASTWSCAAAITSQIPGTKTDPFASVGMDRKCPPALEGSSSASSRTLQRLGADPDPVCPFPLLCPLTLDTFLQQSFEAAKAVKQSGWVAARISY